jgi:hypothetical protein
VSRAVLLLVVALGALRDPCGTDTVGAGLNGPCTRSTDCAEGLSCSGGVCTSLDAGTPDAGAPTDATDAAIPDGSAAD